MLEIILLKVWIEATMILSRMFSDVDAVDLSLLALIIMALSSQYHGIVLPPPHLLRLLATSIVLLLRKFRFHLGAGQ